MSMKDKALLIKEDFDQLYDAGKQSVIANSKYIEKSASGKVIRLDDVSEVYHNVIVKADTPTKVKVYGKNLFNLEVGFAATPYEEYKEPQTITATPDGTETPSICPTMTFLADSDVTVDYFGSYGMAEAELAMWNRLTFNGKRKAYTYAYSYIDLTDMTIPEGLCKPSTAIMYMFYAYEGSTLPKGIDMSGFDVNAVAASYQAFGLCNTSTKLLEVYDMGLGACKTYENAYRNCYKLHTIEIIRCAEHSVFKNTFQNDTELTHCIFEGTIATDINLQWSPKLDMESLGSLFRCLKNFKLDDPDNVHTKTIILSPESWALLDTYVYENGWDDYVNAKDVVSTILGWNYA